MRYIKIINGTYGYRPNPKGSVRPKTANDEPFAVPDEEAKRLVQMKVAEYADGSFTNEVGAAVANPHVEFAVAFSKFALAVGDDAQAISDAIEILAFEAESRGLEFAVGDVATLADGDIGDGESSDSGEDLDGDSGDSSGGDADVRPAYNAEMPVAELKAILAEHGLEYRTGMSRANMVSILDAYFDEAEDTDDGEDAPVVAPENPVL